MAANRPHTSVFKIIQRFGKDLFSRKRDHLPARNGAGSTAQLRAQSRMSGAALVTEARNLLEIAKPFTTDLVARGFAPEWDKGFKDAIDAFEVRLAGKRTGTESGTVARVAVNT